MERYIKAFPQLLTSSNDVASPELTTVARLSITDSAPRYIPRSIIGYGAYATVLKIENSASGEFRCLKVMESHDEVQYQASLKMLQREARLTNSSRSFATMRMDEIHEGVSLPFELIKTLPPATTPTAIAAAASGKGSFFCGVLMEFFEGGTLNQEISARRRKKLPLGEAQAGFLFLQIALALVEAHRHGVMHRDVKPSNIFMRASGLVCLADFGLASDNPRSTTLCGTPFYIAPEMWLQQRPYDNKVDVWSLGVVLYELLTFTRPFVPSDPAARSNEDIKAVILSNTSPPPLPEGTSTHFRELLADMLAHDPSVRPTCEQVLQYPVCKALLILFMRAVRVQAVGTSMESLIVSVCLKALRPPRGLTKHVSSVSRTHSGSVGLSTSGNDVQPGIAAGRGLSSERPSESVFRTATSVNFAAWYRTTLNVNWEEHVLVVTAEDTANEPITVPFAQLVSAFPCSYSTLTGSHEGIVVLVTEAALPFRIQFVTTAEAETFAGPLLTVISSR